MANNYSKILELANKNNMGLSNTIKRDYGIPIDYSSVQASYDDAVVYAATDTLAYIGQPIAVGGTLYIVTDEALGKHSVTKNDVTTEYDVYIKEVGARPEGDNKSIVVGADGKVSMYGFAAAPNSTLPRKKSDGTVEWVAIDAIVQGDGNEKTRVVAADNSDITINEVYNSKNDTYTYTLDVDFPAIPEYSVTKTDGNGIVTYRLIKDGVAIGDAIVIPDAYDDTALAQRVSDVEANISAHGDRIGVVEGKLDVFFGAATEEEQQKVYDTLAEIQEYIANDESGASSMAASIKANTDAIATLNGTGSDSIHGKITAAITEQAAEDAATYATQDELAAVSAKANAAAVKTEVDTALANKISKDELNTKLADYYTKTETYTQTEINALIREITGGEVDPDNSVTALKSRIESHEAESSASFDAINRKNTEQDGLISDNADAIAAINDPTTGIYAKATADAATTAQNKVNDLSSTLTPKVNQNTSDISSLNSQVSGINENIQTLSGKVGTLETKTNTLEGNLQAETSARETLAGTVNQHTTDITSLKAKDEELAAAISANTDKFADYAKTSEVSSLIATEIGKIDHKALEDSIAANKTAISEEVTRAKAREDALAASIKTNSDAISANVREIARINDVVVAAINGDNEAFDSIKELADWISKHDTEVLPVVNANTAAIERLNGTGEGSVAKAVADAVANIPVATMQNVGLVKASSEVTVAQDGTMEIGYVSTDKLIAGNETWVLKGGNAGVVSQ